MKTTFCSVIATKRITAVAAIFAILGLAAPTHATTINFDDLTYIPNTDGECDCFFYHPLADEYLSQGLRISNGYLATYNNYQRPGIIASSPNFLLGGPYLQLTFVGALPKSVSMYVSAAFEDAIFVNAFGPSGFNALVQTLGYAGLPDDIMYVDKQYVSFYSPAGISDITLTSYYGARVGAFVDDLNLEYTRVPEPSPVLLFGMGLLMYVVRRIFSEKNPRKCEDFSY